MEEEEKSRTAVDEATAIAADEVEAEETTTLERSAQIREDCAMLSETACSTTVRSWQQIKKDNHGRNSCNMLARITDNT